MTSAHEPTEREKQAYKDGWNDRESDLINGVERLHAPQPAAHRAGEDSTAHIHEEPAISSTAPSFEEVDREVNEVIYGKPAQPPAAGEVAAVLNNLVEPLMESGYPTKEVAEAPATKNPDWVDIEPFKSNTELAVAWQEWIDQGRSQEQIYGVANFFTGRGGRWLTEVLPNADAPQGAETPAAPQPLNNLDELRDLLHVFAVTYRPETRESRAACIDEAYQAIQRLITAARVEELEKVQELTSAYGTIFNMPPELLHHVEHRLAKLNRLKEAK